MSGGKNNANAVYNLSKLLGQLLRCNTFSTVEIEKWNAICEDITRDNLTELIVASITKIVTKNK